MKKIILVLVAVLSIQISKAQMCVAGFNDSIDSLTVYFTITATGSYNFMQYDFGDGSMPAQIPNPTHTYASSGIYEACQIIYDTTGFCWDYTCDTLYLGGATCGANFYTFPNGLDVEFYAATLGTYDSLSWDFGDGTTSTDSMPMHTYATSGTYTACLSLYNGGTLCDSTCQTISADSTTGSNCTADFTYSANNLNVNFTNTSVGSYNVVYWDFGDNIGFSQQTNPSYTYITAGTYQVCMQIFDTLTGMCFDEMCQDVTVTAGGGGGGTCQAAYTYSTNELVFNGINTSTGAYLTAVWDFGDGSNPSTTPTHTYDAPGEYEVCLTIGNIIPFCFSQECKTVTITEKTCDVDFSWSFNDQNVYAFKNLSSGNFNSVKWEFGDGNTSTFASPSYTYNQVGTYEVCLHTYENGSLCGSDCKDLEVYPLGIENLSDAAAFVMFPNPTTGSFTISSTTSNAEVKIFDVSGRLVFQAWKKNSGNFSIEAALQAGTYFVELKSESVHEIQPLVIR